jgi:hypothetical protein
MTAKTKSERLRRLVSHGYFAPELPPCFVADDLARYRRYILSKIDGFPNTRRGNPGYCEFYSETAWFYFPRFMKDDRKHGVPNPIAHLLVSRAIADHYVSLRRVARGSKLSLSPPVFDWSGPRALVRPGIDLRDDFRIELSSRREIYVAADIRAFFHSIYTHSIAWAIHGKDFAKKNRDINHYGNLIDLLCRNAQDGQTIGLPVGPDTSRLVAEVVAAAIDLRLQDRLKISGRDGSRYIDDYTLSSGSIPGEALLAEIRGASAYFELELNNEKSAILPTSHRLTIGWQEAIRAIIPRPKTPGAAIEADVLQHFLYVLGQVCAEHPDINVEKFGLQNARSAFVGALKWKSVQSNLISAYRRNPSLISLLVEICLLRQARQSDVLLDDLNEFIENRIPTLAQENRTGEIIWLLFLSIRLKISISSSRLDPLFEVRDGFIAVLVAWMNHRGLIRGAIDRTVWDRSLTGDGLRGPMWLYAYEAVTQGVLPGVSDSFIANDPYFKLLREKRVQFLDVDRGYESLLATMRMRRNENERMERLRQAILDGTDDDLDDLYSEDQEDDEFEGEGDTY